MKPLLCRKRPQPKAIRTIKTNYLNFFQSDRLRFYRSFCLNLIFGAYIFVHFVYFTKLFSKNIGYFYKFPIDKKKKVCYI